MGFKPRPPSADDTLWHATFTGDVAVARSALANGADVDAPGDPASAHCRNKTPLTQAVAHGSVELAAFLLERGADVHGKRTYHTPLLHAVRNDELTSLLLAHGAQHTVMSACASGDLDLAKRYLAAPGAIDVVSEERYTSLHMAAAMCDLPMVELLLERGADIGVVSLTGLVALHCAVGSADDVDAQLALVERLLDAGTSPDQPTKRGVTPLHIAVRNRNVPVVKLLLDRGADPDPVDGARGSTPLRRAVVKTGGPGSSASLDDSIAIVELLLARGADPHRRNRAGKTVFEAARNPRLRALLDRASTDR